MNGKEYKLAIRIAGTIDKSFTTSLATANSALRANVIALDKNFVTLDKGFDKIMSTGQKCFSALATAAGVATLAIGAATAASVAVGTEFESAFAGVKKTVDATAEEYERLRQDILEMTRTIPSSASDIATVMEIAGQLGIAKDSLTDFTETMINLGVSTTVSAEEASESLAKFANIMTMENYGKDGISNFERLGSTIVDLGNNFATTEGDIIAIATALAASGKMAAMSEADIMGISAAMSSVGLTAEAGASSMSRLIMQMQMAVASGGDALELYAETANMTGEQFAALFRDDAADAVIEFIAGLNEAGEDSYGILEDLELNTIRTRKAFLSLAGADDLMLNAVNMANEAWDENIALAVEAGKRYETTESQLQIMKNAFAELGITAYDELREPFVGVIGDITESVWEFNEYLGGADGAQKWIKNIETELPTLHRKYNKFAAPVFDGIVGAGKWVIKNGKGIISVLSGIGAALVMYKIASTISHIGNALMALSPTSWVIIGVAAALSALVAACTAYKLQEQEMIDNNLTEHFGKIALSMEEIQAVAEHIVGSESLNSVKKALEVFEDVDAIAAAMEGSLSEIEKMNWMVSIGMELTPDEQEQYKTAIDEYVATAQEYALTSQYAVSINLSMAFSDEDIENANVVDKVNQFYQDKYGELSELGTKLNTAVTDAFNDGLLDIKETKVIAQIQAQMAEIQEALATGEFDAQLSVLGMEYRSGTSLSADSFQNLQTELAAKVAEAEQAYKESYAQNYASIQAAYEAGDYLTEVEYQTALEALEERYLQNVGELELKAIQFQIGTIKQAYGDEISEFYDILNQAASDYIDEWSMTDWAERPVTIYDALLEEAFNSNSIDESTKKAMEQLLEAMEPSVESLEELKQQYADAGLELSDEMLQAFSDLDLLGALTARRSDTLWGVGLEGDQKAARNFLSGYIANDEDFQGVEDILRGYGWEFPEELASGIKASAEVSIPPAVEGMYAWSQEKINEYYSQGFTAEADVRIKLNPMLNGLRGNSLLNTLPRIDNIPINQRANGGLATRPELTWFAEKGPEMAIPIDGSQNAISLWEQTGRLLGMDSVLDGLEIEGGGAPSIEYSPTLQFYGGTPSKEDLTDALKISQDEFDDLMERYFKTHARVSFG